MANTSILLTSLDFADYKNSLRTYLSAQPQFQDYNFDASNLSVILDLLAYNTYINAYYLNMIGSEMFLDTAQLRDSVVLKAKELNYTPRSFRSAMANVNLTITASGTSIPTIITIPAGTSFTGKAGSNNYTFSTDQNIVIQSGNGVFIANNVALYEGTYVTDTFVIQPAANTVSGNATSQRYTLSNPTIDTTSLSVVSIENNGANIIPYTLTTSSLDVTSASTVYWLQGAENGLFELVFGDNVIGRTPTTYSTVVAEYRTTNGQLPNGIAIFTPNGTIGGSSNIVVSTVSSASGGDIAEDIEAIRFNAPKFYSTQDRAVTTADYESLLKLNFPEIQAISVYGGEEATPPQYGTVIISMKIANFDAVPDSKKTAYSQFLSTRAPLTIQPIFIEPNYLYASVSTTIKYNVNITALTTSDIETFVTSAIQTYNNTYLNNFNSTLLYSRLVAEIDAADSSIVSNQTTYDLMSKFYPTTTAVQNYQINFNTPLNGSFAPAASIHPVTEEHTISSTKFVYNQQIVSLEDDGAGNVRIVQEQADGNHHTILNIGTINYSTGVLILSNFYCSSYFGDSIRIYGALPEGVFDSSTNQNTIFEIPNDEINVTVEVVRL